MSGSLSEQIESRYLLRINLVYEMKGCWDEETQTEMAENYLNGMCNPDPAAWGGRLCELAEMLHYVFETMVKRYIRGNEWLFHIQDVYFRFSSDRPVSRWHWRFTGEVLTVGKRLTLTIPVTMFSIAAIKTELLAAKMIRLLEDDGDDRTLAGTMLEEVLFRLGKNSETAYLNTITGAEVNLWLDGDQPVELVSFPANER